MSDVTIVYTTVETVPVWKIRATTPRALIEITVFDRWKKKRPSVFINTLAGAGMYEFKRHWSSIEVELESLGLRGEALAGAVAEKAKEMLGEPSLYSLLSVS